ncbi:solute carrier family member 5 [Stylonychia lemnae]|uniref:Solute carrier family member 5 n=1 Tax=Stylonychia lemnae TaxID=5949 RepID=A0A078AC97_STYLE|nr:solute carrier family member 5 [Stylonychia lemnae]|eukprot:CDW79844.1 solute carrier family member 5 [Stylonychia lemnae]
MDTTKYIERCIDLAGGGNSRFHKIFGFLLSVIFGNHCVFLYGLGLYEEIPQLKCFDQKSNKFQQCSQIQACSDGIEYQIDYQSDKTIINWMTKYDLVCASKFDIALIGTLLMIGYMIGSVFFVRLGDFYGRKLVVTVSVLISSISFIGIFFSPNIIYVDVFILIYGMTCGPRGLAYVYILELTTKKYEFIYSTLPMALDAISMLILGVYFLAFSDMYPLLLSVTIIQTVAMVLVMIYVPESPKQLYEKCQYQQFYQSIRRIAKFNKITIEDEDLITIANDLQDENQNVAINSTDYVDLEEKNSSNKQKIKDSKINRQGKLIKSFQSKNLITAFLAVLSVVSLIMYIADLTLDDDTTLMMVLMSFLVFALRAFSSLNFMTVYYANNEYFPTLLKGAIFSVTNISARVASVFSPIVADGVSNPAITLFIFINTVMFNIRVAMYVARKYRLYWVRRLLYVYGVGGYFYAGFGKNMAAAGYMNNFLQPVDYSLTLMLDLGSNDGHKYSMQIVKILNDSMQSDGKLDNLDWLLLGQHFSKNAEEEMAFQVYQMVHLKDHQRFRTNSELKFETNSIVREIRKAT